MTTPQLVVARQFFDEARREPAASTPFMRMRRTMNLDLCVEIALNAVVHDHGTAEEQRKQGGPRPLVWHELWDLAEGVSQRKVSKSLPERARLKTLHDQRNLAQHRGSMPSVEDIRDKVEPTRALLDFVCREFYGREFERLQEWDALECRDLRLWIGDCAEAAERGSVFPAMMGCRALFRSISDAVTLTTTGGFRPIHNIGSTIRIEKCTDSERVARAFLDMLKDLVGVVGEIAKSLDTSIVAVGLGMSFADHARFGRLLRALPPDYRAGLNSPPTDRDWRIDDAIFMVSYLGRASVMLESAMPGVFDELALPERLRNSSVWPGNNTSINQP